MFNRYLDKTFDVVDGYGVMHIQPNVFGDNRGSFSEVLAGDQLLGVKQINRSKSSPMVFRGFHAQSGKSCQAKLVEAVNAPIYDLIIDARPMSKTFGTAEAYLLDPTDQNKLYVPRGFLHSFAVPKILEKEAIFMYYCDNAYDKASEICISPKTALAKFIPLLKDVHSNDEKFNMLFNMFENEDKVIMSNKDLKGLNYASWMQEVQDDWRSKNEAWYALPNRVM